MISKTKHRIKVSSPNIKGSLFLNYDRFETQFRKAQYLLDSRVMDDMVSYMPMETGTFINLTRARSQAIAGSGKVYAAAPPYGRFLYKGKTMVDESTGSTWARKAAKKVLVSQYSGKTNAKEELAFSNEHHPKVEKEWFEAAKRDNRGSWIKLAKKTAGGD